MKKFNSDVNVFENDQKKKVSCDEVLMENARYIRLAKFHGMYIIAVISLQLFLEHE